MLKFYFILLLIFIEMRSKLGVNLCLLNYWDFEIIIVVSIFEWIRWGIYGEEKCVIEEMEGNFLVGGEI